MFTESLNSSQLDAVYDTEGPLLVIAGAGSGKTRTLTYRVAHLVEKGVPPSDILLLTFTRKASSEMLKRATQLLDYRCENVSGGTFHSFAYAMLRRYSAKVGFDQNFSVLDRADAVGLIGMLRKEMGFAAKSRSFPRKQTLANIFSRSVNKVLSIEEIVSDDYPHFISELDSIDSLFNSYRRRKAETQFFDYDDLLVYLKTLLTEYTDIRERVSSAYRYIMVDEYQDTNQIQAKIVYLLAGATRNVMAVGDDSQSIYSFRGAHFKNIMNFPDMFPGTRIVRLEENYRSVQPILNLANDIIDRAKEKYTKVLFTQKTGGSIPSLVSADTENSQSRFVVKKVKELNQEGIPYKQMAVLFRASFHAFDLEIELGREEVPYIKVGGFKFIESAHIKDVLAHLRVFLNASDRLSWYRILLLLEKVGPKTAGDIYNAVMKEKTGYTGLLSVSVKSGQSKGIGRLKDLFSHIDSENLSVSRMGETVLKYYLPLLRERYDDHPKRERDLEHLVSIMERYDSLARFLADMALDPPNTSINDTLSTDDPEEDRLVLSTVHSAKGLEWHTVFIIWCLEGRFPSIHALNSDTELEEERRLMYVAATRAMENLFFIYPDEIYDRGLGRVLSRPSRFLDSIPDRVLKKESAGEW
ncbi:MAG: ATP-dependent helicase [Deltaproteobacteria bacterium]|nr:ATP-dependent helicase [Deltaproteobacteria bacterium]